MVYRNGYPPGVSKMAQPSQKSALLMQNFASELLLMYQDKERGGFCPLFLLFITQSRYRQGRAQRACFGLA